MSLPFLFGAVWVTHFSICPMTDKLQDAEASWAVEHKHRGNWGPWGIWVTINHLWIWSTSTYVSGNACVCADNVNISSSFRPVRAKCGPDRCVLVSSNVVVSLSRSQFLVVCKRVTVIFFWVLGEKFKAISVVVLVVVVYWSQQLLPVMPEC